MAGRDTGAHDRGAPQPRIVAPVSRLLAVADTARSTAFYQDVLGFTARPATGDAPPGAIELVRDEARLAVARADTTLDSTLQPRPRGAAILFLAVSDVAALRAEVVARGGAPSELEKVNWIKMRLFQVTDPDGHTLWFGQSFQEPDRPRDQQRQLRQLLPDLPLADVQAAVAWYQRALGFHINWYDGGPLAVMSRDDVTLLLSTHPAPRAGTGACYAYIHDADSLHAELTARGAPVQGEPVSHPWGLRDFAVLDLEGNRLTFGETFE